jgi:hypothetical protein
MERVFGTVFRLSEDAESLRELDEYEGFDPNAPEQSLFVRKLYPVQLSSGRFVRCWVYAYNQSTKRARVVTSGRQGKAPRAQRAQTMARTRERRSGSHSECAEQPPRVNILAGLFSLNR